MLPSSSPLGASRVYGPPRIVPDASVLSIAAQLERFDGGSGSITVTNGVAFRPGDLTSAKLTAQKLRVFVSGVEQAIYTEALNGRHPDGSVKVVLIQFTYTFSTPLSAEIRLGETRQTTDISKQAVTSQPAGFLFPTSPVFLCAATPLYRGITPMSNRPTGTYWDRWEQKYSSTSPYTTVGSKIYFDNAVAEPVNGNKYIFTYGTANYNWACHHYEFFAMTGQAKYLYRGLLGANFFFQYNALTDSPAWGEAEWQLGCIVDTMLHYWMTGVTSSRDACYTAFQNSGILFNVSAAQLGSRTYQYNHGRVAFDHLMPLVVGHHLGLSPAPDWESGTAATWAAKALKCVDAFISQQFSDGHNTWPDTNTVYPAPATQQNWQVFLRSAGLIMYHKWVDPDSRIYQHVLDGYNYINATYWVGGTCADDCAGWTIVNDSGYFGRPPLNGMTLEVIAWLYRQSGDAALLTRGDLAVQGVADSAFWPVTGTGDPKLFSEENWGLMSYIGARQGVA